MNFIIKSIAITGFKGYKERTEIQLGPVRTLISGENGKGKSSTGEAICWCITGCDIYGNEKAATRLINDDKPKLTEVELECVIDGENVTIIRRKKGASTDLYMNEKKVNNSDIADIYKSKDIFLSIFNPYYFPALAPKDAKSLLSGVLGTVKREEIFAELGKYLTDILKKNNFKIPETFVTDKNAEIKEQKDNIVFLEGVIEGSTLMKVSEKKTFDDTELKAAENELEQLKKSNIDVELAKLQKPKDITVELSELRAQEIELKSMLNNIDLQELLPIEAKRRLKNELLMEYKSKKNKFDTMESKTINCDSCGNEIDLTKEAREMLNQEIEEILDKGKQLKIEIEEIEAKNAEIAKNNQKFKFHKEDEINKKLNEIVTKRAELLANNEKAQEEYEKNRQAIIDKNSISQAENKAKIEFLKMKISTLEDEKQKVIDFNASVDAALNRNIESEQAIKKAKERITNSKNKIEELKLAIDAGKQYNSIKLNKQTSTINKYLDKVKLQFEELTKDGELKEKFKILYEDKEFNKLSNSERIKAGLEISNLISNVMNLKLPVFVDDSESITKVPKLNTQMILTKVVEGLEEIKVEVIE